jgi:HK97 family phage major capsid protein
VTLKELQEQRRTLAAKIKEVANRHDKDKGWQGEDEAEYTRLNGEYDAVLKQIEETQAREAAAETISSRLGEIDGWESRSRNAGGTIPGLEDTRGEQREAVTDEVRALALAGFCRGAMGQPQSDQHIEAMRRCRIQPWQRELVFNLPDTSWVRGIQEPYRTRHASVAGRESRSIAEQRAMSATTFATGGALVPETLVRSLELNMLAFGGIRAQAETIVTGSGERMSWPTADDTSNQGEQIGESVSIGSSVEPSFGAIYWDAYKISSKAVLVPYELLEDSFLNLPSLLGEMLGERIGRFTATRYTTGTGANQAKGYITAAALGVTAASASAIASDEIFNLVHSIDPAYRTSDCTFSMHDNVLLHLRKLKDGEGRYMWQEGLTSGAPDRLAGYGVWINQSMASSVATGNKTICFGQHSRYKIRRVNQVRMYRLEERYRDTDQDGFIALVREDGNLLATGTSPLKYLQQA